MTPLSNPTASGRPAQHWKVSFADLLALILSFFVLLFSMSSPKPTSQPAVRSGVANPDMPQALVSKVGQKEGDPGQRTAEGLNLGYLTSLLRDKLAASAILQDARVDRIDEQVRVRQAADALFVGDSAELTASGRQALELLAGALARLPNRIQISTHRDPPGDDQAAAARMLSLRQAAVIGRLFRRAGFNGALELAGHGSSRFNDIRGASMAQRRLAARYVEISLFEQSRVRHAP